MTEPYTTHEEKEIRHLKSEIERLRNRVKELENRLSNSGDWHTTGNPVPYKPADGQW